MSADTELVSLRKEVECYRALGHLIALDIAFVSFEGHAFFTPSDPEGRNIAFNILCSDTFEYACADSEGMTLQSAPEILSLYKTQGWSGVARWVQEKRGGPDRSPFVCRTIESISAYQTPSEELVRLRKENASLWARLDSTIKEVPVGISNDEVRHDTSLGC